MTSRMAWLVLTIAVVTWELYAGFSGMETLTSEFRRSVTDSSLRWPVLLVATLVMAHLFLPASLRRYDPIDRAYYAATGQPNPYEETAPHSEPGDAPNARPPLITPPRERGRRPGQ